MLMNQSPCSCEIAPHQFRPQATAGAGAFLARRREKRNTGYSRRLFSVPQMVTSENKRNRGRHACCISLVSVWWGGSMGKLVRRCALNRWAGGGVGVGDPRMLGGLHCPPVVFVPHVIPAQRHTNHLLAIGGGCRSVGLEKNVYAYDYREKNDWGGVRQRESALRQTHSATGGARE